MYSAPHFESKRWRKVTALFTCLLFLFVAACSSSPTSPSDTTAPPADTTEPPSDTSEPPADTSEPPADTAEPPADTTEPPADTTAGTDCTNDDQCAAGAYCDFNNDDCGAWGATGVCTASPNTCVAGGAGACGCNGAVATNDCEIQGSGTDYFKYGGCLIDGEPGHRCGDTFCDPAAEFCTISMNDVAGENEPEYYANCAPIPDGCGPDVPVDCSCVPTTDFGECYDGGEMVFIFYPGG